LRCHEQNAGAAILIPDFNDLKEAYAKVEASGMPAVYDHEWMRLAMQRIEELESSSQIGTVSSYSAAINQLQSLAHWFRDNNNAYYFAVDTQKANEDGVPIVCCMHSLHRDEQFVALHKYVEQSRENAREKVEEQSDEN